MTTTPRSRRPGAFVSGRRSPRGKRIYGWVIAPEATVPWANASKQSDKYVGLELYDEAEVSVLKETLRKERP